jgi:hypothetical protein
VRPSISESVLAGYITSEYEVAIYLPDASGRILLSIQGPVNSRLRLALESPVFAATISFLSGGLILLCIMTTGAFGAAGTGLRGFQSAPIWAYLGGVLGVGFSFSAQSSVAAFPNPPGSLASGRMAGDVERHRKQNAIDRKPRSNDWYPVHTNTAFLSCTAGNRLIMPTLGVSFTDLAENKPVSAESMDFALGRLIGF